MFLTTIIMNSKFITGFKKISFIVFLFLFVVIIGHWVTGYGYVLKGVCFAYFRGQSGPGIDEAHLFYNNQITSKNSIKWKESKTLSKNKISPQSTKQLNLIKTTSFLVVKNNELIYEKYWEGFDSQHPTNSFSAVKSIVSLLIGIAIDEGFIKSVDQPVSDFLNSFKTGEKSRVTIKDLLTMSSGLNWSESGGNPYSDNARAYYGEDLLGQVNKLKSIEAPGKTFKYKSGNTQVLGYIVEKATGSTISDYLEKKIWLKIHAEHDAFWNLDKINGDEKAFCCLYLVPRDYAKLGQLIINKGKLNNQQVISESFLNSSLQPASYLKETNGSSNVRYGWHWWLAKYKNQEIFYARGINGQYIIVWPKKDLVIVRTGKKRRKVASDGHPEDFWDYLKIAEELIQ